jgi:hypothetical protein
MSTLKNKCYYCGQPKTSMEHVPPKVFFPDKKYSHNDINHRQELITVPSCDVHNSNKSHLDEYLFVIMAINILANENGQHLALNKAVDKIIKRKPKLFKEVLGSAQEVLVDEYGLGELQSTFAFEFDKNKLDECFDYISRGIYFHHFQKNYEGKVKSRYQFVVSLDSDSVTTNKKLEEYRQFVKERLNNIEKHGQNTEVFYYKVLEEGSDKVFFQLSFYESLKIDIFLLTESS